MIKEAEKTREDVARQDEQRRAEGKPPAERPSWYEQVPAADGPAGASLAPMAPASPTWTKAEPCRWREAVGVVDLGEHDTPYQAKGRAIALARKRAIKDLLGVEVRAREAVFQQESLAGQQALVESLIMSTQSGLILDEKVLEAKPVAPAAGGMKYRVHLKTCVARLPEKMDKGFQVMLDLNKENFANGDDAMAIITVTRDACVYLLNIDQDGNWTLVFPNSFAPENCTSADRPIRYPDAHLLKMGVHMKAELPPGRRISMEALRVVAFKSRMDHLFRQDGGRAHADKEGENYSESYQVNVGRFSDLVRRLVAEEVEWVDDSSVFVIHAK